MARWHWAIYLFLKLPYLCDSLRPRDELLPSKPFVGYGYEDDGRGPAVEEESFIDEGDTRVDDHHPPLCQEEYTCDRPEVESTSHHHNTMRIAVYTYNIGGYESMRSDFVPCVPPHVDAFLFIDDVGMRRFGKTVKNWEKVGWQVKFINQVPETKYVSGPRLTSKSLKFTPPSWLLNGTWHWLVGHDGDIVLDLHRLYHFAYKQRRHPLVLLNWDYHSDCTGDGFKCFMTEVTSMLGERLQYVARSKVNVVKWKELLEKMHEGKLTHGGRKYLPPNYFETNVIFRNLKHSKASKVRDAFERTFLKCREIQRDQFLLPFFLWQDELSRSTKAVPIDELVNDVGFCMVSTRVGRN